MNISTINTYDDYYIYDTEVVQKGKVPIQSVQKTLELSIVVALCISTTTSNLITVAAVLCVPLRNQVLDFYILSLAITNLLVSIVVIPFSLAAKTNVLGHHSYILCSISGYLHVSLSAVYMYTFMWTAVDRYLAVRKPLRYDIIQTRTRCRCWIVFSWLMATCLCCPPLLGDSRGHFYHESFMCLLDVNSMLPYSITLSCLVLMPSVLTLCYTYSYIFSSPAPDIVPRDEANRRGSDHVTMFIVTGVFVLMWMPWGLLRVWEQISNAYLAGPTVRFWLLFLGQTHTLWIPIILLSTCNSCQIGLRNLCRCCLKTETSISV